ncbi:aldo/keto reductase [Candidatus Peregrinibacteria bacterium]|nr:aldo/keto reductase [Candidatus Peregrinibacteria bacterium]
MELQQIPKTDLKVSQVCLGTMTFGTPVGESDAIKLVHYGFDKGINFIDTANMYEGYSRYMGSHGGIAEKIVGKAISGQRSKFVVATKVGMKVGEAPEDEFTSALAIRKHLDLSLKRLDTDYIDIYYLHKPDPVSPLIETLTALTDIIQSGRIRYYGISNYSSSQTVALLKIADENSLPRPVVHQSPLSLLRQELCNDLLPLCKKEQIAVIPYQVLQGGLLTGKYRRGEPVPLDSRKAEKDAWVWEMKDELFDKMEEIEKKARQSNLTMTEYAIQWVLKQPAVVSAIIGVKRASQLDDAVTATEKIKRE